MPTQYQSQERKDVMFNRLDIEDSPVQDSSIHVWAPPKIDGINPFETDGWLTPVTGRNGVY